eukprot:TRINITY_DN323_c0_g1_i9.p3 TRINITY_DN323_c0_g1~~TRINITY_DN323_c0_g1_i9.p3  ORF type:complete len:160 (-),score=6.62 TRINITY_DN323_c0_g1_i9:14-493(-)
MGTEIFDEFPYNAGISVMNIFNLCLNYQQFVDFILSNKEALYFSGYGPGDQGALNQFYEITVRQWLLPQKYNAKPYKQFDEDTVIVHFHGPKPHDYYQFGVTGQCRPIFEQLCRMAMVSGMCQYVQEWATYAKDDEIGQKLAELCTVHQDLIRSRDKEN